MEDELSPQLDKPFYESLIKMNILEKNVTLVYIIVLNDINTLQRTADLIH